MGKLMDTVVKTVSFSGRVPLKTLNLYLYWDKKKVRFALYNLPYRQGGNKGIAAIFL
jgi:hypothetical protein